MRTLKSVTLATTTGKESSRFVTKNSIPRTPENSSANGGTKKMAQGVIGSRSVNATKTVDDKEVVVPDVIDAEISALRKEMRALGNDRLDGAETADVNGTMDGVADDPMHGGLPANTTTADVVIRGFITPVLENIVSDINPYRTNKTLNRIFRDMYQHDATTGSAIELMSTLPFSDFTLAGLKDERILQIFIDSLESMSIGNLLPNISIDFMSVGAVILSLAFDDRSKKFVGVTPHNIDFANFLQVPVFNIDPQITITFPPHLMESFKNRELMDTFKDYMPQEILKQLNLGPEGSGNTGSTRGGRKQGTNHDSSKKGGTVGEIKLDNRTTIFIPRRGMFQDFRGVSILKRALPAWFYEKALIAGTHDQVYKRQRATLHITAGEGEEWVPTAEELQGFANLFMSADLDPLGAVVVTRTGVQTNEIRRGDDFWRWDSEFDALEKIKLRAMGVSEAFVTGDATYSNMEQALSVFVDQIRTYRGQITKELFYEKMFPMISHANNITKQRYGSYNDGEIASWGGTTRAYRDKMTGQLFADIGSNLPVAKELAADDKNKKIDVTKLLIPEVVWHKRLMPEADADYMNLLQTMDQLGAPITIRTLTAAGGLKLDKLMEGLDEDLRVREKISEYKKQVNELNAQAGVGDEEGGGAGSEFANFLVDAELGTGSVRRKSVLSRGNPDHPASQFHGRNHRGQLRPLTKKGRDVVAERFNKNLASAAAEMARQQNAKNKAEAPEPTKKYYHGK